MMQEWQNNPYPANFPDDDSSCNWMGLGADLEDIIGDIVPANRHEETVKLQVLSECFAEDVALASLIGKSFVDSILRGRGLCQ